MAGVFAERRVLITGGTSGIGLALAHAFVASGARVAVCGRDEQRLKLTRDALPGVLALRCDLQNDSDVAAMLAEVDRAFGGIDIFVSNAGGAVERDFNVAPSSTQGLAEELHLNFVVPIVLTGKVLPMMARRRASIIMVTSGFALVSPTRSPTYGAAKAGLRAFTRALRRQLRGRVQVLEVLPPAVDTPATAHRGGSKLSPEAVARAVLKGVVDGREDMLLGQVRYLPLLLRLAPRFAERLVGAQ